jgi:hypothetical protein
MPVTKQEQEALSRRYAYYAIVTPLEDGSFAVFSNDRTAESMLIVEDNDDLAMAITSRANMNRRKTPSRGRDVDLDMDSLLE